MDWLKLNSRLLLKHPRLEVYEDTVKLPSGIETEYLHFGAELDASMIIARDTNGKILVQREYSYPPNEYLFQFPGGKHEAQETPEEGAAREFIEECGLRGDLTEIGWFYTNNRRSSQKLFVFAAENLTQAQTKPDPEESFEDFWFTPDEIEASIRSNEFKNYTLLAGWSIYKLKLLDT